MLHDIRDMFFAETGTEIEVTLLLVQLTVTIS